MQARTIVVGIMAALGVALSASACMTFVAGKKVSATGRVIVGHNEDDWPPLVVHHGMLPARDWPAGSCLPATPGCCAAVPQAPHTLACYWGEVKFPYGDGNADTFLNERGVFVVSDSGGNSTERMDDPSLLTDGGVKFNLRRAVGERATSARDGVRIIGELVEKYGYAPSARIYTVADADEAWLVQVVHGRNYVAVRCPDDEVTVMPNLYTVYELDAFPAEDVIASKGLVENAKRKGFWDGTGRFNFAKAYQGSYDYGPERAFEHPNNTGRFRQAIRLLTGEEWPEGKPFPFSVKPAKGSFSVDDMRALLSAHNELLKDGKHVLETWSICSSTTIESSICEFASTPRGTVYHLALGRGCEKPYVRLRPFAEPLPAAIDESATAEARLEAHVRPEAPAASPGTCRADAAYRLERRGNVLEAFRRGRRFAVLAPAESDDWRIEADASGEDFIRFEFVPAAGRKGTFRFPEIRLDGAAANMKAVGSQGFTTLADNVGSAMYLAAADPKSRRGVVAAWLTSEKGSPLVRSAVVDGVAVLKPELQFGKIAASGGETFVLGAFDDCRLGLEAYADAVAAHYAIRLKPQIAGYTTWYDDRWGYSKGYGAGTPRSAREFADAVERLRLGDFGFTFFQIDDFWQDGLPENGPCKNFTRTDPNGPFPDGMKPTADYLRSKGILPGIWYMPFSGTQKDAAWWGDKQGLFVRDAETGKPYEVTWGGTCLDMTNPDAVRYMQDVTRRICREWGYGYVKYDGMWTAMGCKLAKESTLGADGYNEQVFADSAATGVEAYRRGVKAMREAAGEDTFILACNLAQNVRAMGATYGLVDACRIGGDNGPIDRFPGRYMIGVSNATPRYFLNGRVWYSDPDPVYVRDAVSLDRARLFATWTSLAGMLYNFSDWLPDLSPERVDVLKRTMAPHGIKTVRPVDFFERTHANVWVLEKGDVRVFGLYNWSTNETLSVAYPAAYVGLDQEKTYVGFDFWANELVPPFKGKFAFDVPPDSCRAIAVREVLDRPFVVSTSRHVASPAFDVAEERWDAATRTLSGRSTVVPGEPYELRIFCGGRLRRASFEPTAADFKWKVEADDLLQ